MEIPVNNRVILNKKTTSESIETLSGVKITTDFFFSEIISFDSSSVIQVKVGQIVCVPKNRVIEVPYGDTMQYCCYLNDIVHYKDNPKDSVDKNL